MEPLVSVVTPFHNTGDLLAECIESVIAQSYENWEYILVNNQSRDGAEEVAARYANADPRITLLHTDELLHQNANYNAALRHISSESRYCKIVQADDWIFDDCLARMVALGEAHPSVGIISAYSLAGTEVYNAGLPYTRNVWGGREITRQMLLENQFYMGSPTSVLYRSAAVRERDPFFPPDRAHDDTEACYEILQEWDFGFVHRMLSFIRTDNEGILGGVRGLDPWALERYVMVVKYGRSVLNDEELRAVHSRTRKHSLEQLWSFLRTADRRAAWQYYRRELEAVGEKATLRSLLPLAAREAADILLNPLRTVRRTLGWIARKRGSRPD